MGLRGADAMPCLVRQEDVSDCRMIYVMMIYISKEYQVYEVQRGMAMMSILFE